MHWNNRIVRVLYPNGTSTLMLAEVFYEDGKPIDWCAASTTGASKNCLKRKLQLQQKALKAPTLTYSVDTSSFIE